MTVAGESPGVSNARSRLRVEIDHLAHILDYLGGPVIAKFGLDVKAATQGR